MEKPCDGWKMDKKNPVSKETGCLLKKRNYSATTSKVKSALTSLCNTKVA
jgi:hypothetical protein